MPNYIVNDNAQPTGEREVHEMNCRYVPQIISYTKLGYHSNCQSAVIAARQYYPDVDGCKVCSSSCHTR